MLGGQGNSTPLDFTTLFDTLSPEYRNAVVSRVLRSREQIIGETSRVLDSAIRGSIRLLGYANPALAIPAVLQEPVAFALSRSENLAGATLQAWVATHEPLHQLVLEHLTSQEISAEYPDLTNNSFRNFWDIDLWERQLDWMAEINSQWVEDDIALMLCYVSGRTINPASMDSLEEEPCATPQTLEPAVDPAGSALKTSPEPAGALPLIDRLALPQEPAAPLVPEAATPSGPVGALTGELTGPWLLSDCIAYLQSLSPEAPDWEEAVPGFVATINEVRELKTAQREKRAALSTAQSEISQEFSGELDFLESDLSQWSPGGLTDLATLDRMLDLIAVLGQLLAEYRRVLPPGRTLSEETNRRERRQSVEPQILDALRQLKSSPQNVSG